MVIVSTWLGFVHMWRRVGLERFLVEGSSMAPTLHDGDAVWVARGRYGDGERVWAQPRPGERIVARNPVDGEIIVKRVVAVGGQTVEGRSGRLFVDGEPISPSALANGRVRCAQRRERDYRVCAAPIADFSPRTIPPDHVFILGDHRERSNDSRNPLLGPLHLRHVIGPIVLAPDVPDASGGRR